MAMNEAERETMGLCIAVEALNDIANRALLEVRPVQSLPGEAEVYFHSGVHQQLFLARLLDFSKESGSKALTGTKGSCLDVVAAACESRSFNDNGSVSALVDATKALRDWLGTSATLQMWIPTLEIEAKVTMPRSDLVFIMGNHVKHNLARLTGVSRAVGALLREHGYSVQDELVPLALDDIREHLLDDYFVYYGAWMAELVNNVRWGIHDYLRPTFTRTYTKVAGHPFAYEYEYPGVIGESIARQWFWRLMNHVRDKPYFERFTGAHYLKKGASIERH